MDETNVGDVKEPWRSRIGAAMVEAALVALDRLPRPGSVDLSPGTIARAVVAAIAACEKVLSEETEKLEKSLGDALPHLDLYAEGAAATAFWMWSEEVDLPRGEYSADSVAGGRLLGFAQGVMAAQRAAEFAFLLDEEEGAIFPIDGALGQRLAKQLETEVEDEAAGRREHP